MRLLSPLAFIELGFSLRTISQRDAGDRIDGDGRLLHLLQRVRQQLDDNGLGVSFEYFIAHFDPLILRLNEEVILSAGKEATLRGEEAKEIREHGTTLEHVVAAEVRTRLVCVPVDYRFKYNTLLKTPETLLGEGIFSALPDIAKKDFVAGCRCLALGCETACAYHVLRCMETMVRLLYAAYFPSRDANRAWGALTGELKSKPKKPKPPDLVLAQLDSIRENFRNPTQHPEKNYDRDEASDLLFSCLEPIGRLLRDQRVSHRLSRLQRSSP